MGILGITLTVSVGAYFAVTYIPYYQQQINSAFVITIVSGIISFVISAIYLSMIDISTCSVLQCHLADHEAGNGKTSHGHDSVRNVLLTQ
jgi:hypothetical protein